MTQYYPAIVYWELGGGGRTRKYSVEAKRRGKRKTENEGKQRRGKKDWSVDNADNV
jgi:hypothetical protein